MDLCGRARFIDLIDVVIADCWFIVLVRRFRLVSKDVIILGARSLTSGLQFLEKFLEAIGWNWWASRLKRVKIDATEEWMSLDGCVVHLNTCLAHTKSVSRV